METIIVIKVRPNLSGQPTVAPGPIIAQRFYTPPSPHMVETPIIARLLGYPDPRKQCLLPRPPPGPPPDYLLQRYPGLSKAMYTTTGGQNYLDYLDNIQRSQDYLHMLDGTHAVQDGTIFTKNFKYRTARRTLIARRRMARMEKAVAKRALKRTFKAQAIMGGAGALLAVLE